MFLLESLLERIVRIGTLTVTDAGGRTHTFAGEEGPHVRVRLHDRVLPWRLFFKFELATGEAFTDGSLTVEEGDIYDLMDLMGTNLAISGPPPSTWLMRRMEWALRLPHQFNPVSRARRNVQHHYDLSDDLYGLFLDSDRQYSCAYFRHGDEDLETAQEAKKRHIARKLLLAPGHKVLDIGSGWGGLALHLATQHGADVTGMTLSNEQFKVSESRARGAGLEESVRFFLRDYREQEGSFDRIVSVGMFEHVGIGHFRTFFDKMRALLNDDGVALLHTIGRSDPPGITDPWIRRYIFPGGYIPALSEILPAIERAGLCVTDIEVLRLHYAETLRHWRHRFLANRDRAKALYDERFCRMWEYYLATSEMAFRHLHTVVFQIQITKRQDAVPLTRDYMTFPAKAAAGTAGDTGDDGRRAA